MPSREKTPATMIPKECIDLVTPEADRQPRARRSALPSHAAAVTLSFDLTTETPLPVSARGIADDDNDRRGGNACHDSDRPPDLPRLHKTRDNERSNTSQALAPINAPDTNSSSLPRRKKSRSLRRRYSGKENSSSNVSALSLTPVENRKSPSVIPKRAPGGRENLVPVVDVLAGKNSPVTLSESRLDSVRVPILVVMNKFRGPREIPHFLNGVFMGQFLPQVQIPADPPHGEIIRWAAATLHTLPAYLTRSDYIEHRI